MQRRFHDGLAGWKRNAILFFALSIGTVAPGRAEGFQRARSAVVRNCGECHFKDSAIPEAYGAFSMDDLIASRAGVRRRPPPPTLKRRTR